MPTNIQDTQLMSSISAQQLVIKDIFCDKFLFSIPNYQRPYSWEEDHCIQLLDDLHSFAFKKEDFNNLSPYFLGSAVIIKSSSDRKSQIVDGQQRLTSLTILLSCLRYSIEDKNIKNSLSGIIYQKEDLLTGASATYRLMPRKRDRDFFKKVIQDEDGLTKLFNDPNSFIPQNDAQKQIVTNAKAFIKEFSKKDYSEEQLKTLAIYIVQKCVLVIVASTDEDAAFRIFNVLNDRGKDLTIADILKSEILEKIPEEEQSYYTEKWEECESLLGINNFKDFFSHLRAIYAQKKAEKSILTEIREYVKPSDKPKDFIDKILIPFSNAYLNILNSEYKAASFAEDINNQFLKLKRVTHTDWIPSAIYFLAKHSNSPLEVKEFFIQLERVTLGMEAMRTSLNERLERYAKINSMIEKNKNLFEEGSEFILNVRDREAIISTLNSPDIYGKRLVKPVLAKIEEQMNDNSICINYNSLSIEHILPQSPNNPYWMERFTSEDISKFTNYLGNMTLISVRKNSQARNYDFETKINVYFKTDGKASNLAMVNNLTTYKEWTPKSIKCRNIYLINQFLNAINLYPIENSEDIN